MRRKQLINGWKKSINATSRHRENSVCLADVRLLVDADGVAYVYLTLKYLFVEGRRTDRPWLVLRGPLQPRQPLLAVAVRAGVHPCCNQ